MPLLEEEPVSSIFFIPLFLIVLVFLLFISFLLNIYELTVFSSVLLAAGSVSYLWSVLSLKKLAVSFRCEKNAFFSGEEIALNLEASNEKSLPILLSAEVFMENMVLKKGNRRQAVSGKILYPFKKTSIPFMFSPVSRGIYNLYPPEIRSGDIFGFRFRKKEEKGPPVEITVYPFIYRIILPDMSLSDYSGTVKGKGAVSDRILIKGVRDYTNGGNIRYIHWKSSAKYNVLKEKVFDSAEKEKLLIIFDVNNYQDFELFEKSVETAASFILMPEMRKKAAGLLTNGSIYNNRNSFIPVSSGSQQHMILLETLTGIKQKKGKSISEILEKGSCLSAGLSCLYFTSSVSDELHKADMILRKRRIPVKYVISDGNNCSLQGSRYYLVKDLYPGNKAAAE